MKLAFFLIAFSLVFIRVYFKDWWPGHHSMNDVSITIQNGDDYEQVRWGGQITFSPGEDSIKIMSPGAFIRYKHNDTRFSAESNVKGEISYGSAGTAHMKEAIGEMIAYGFDAKARMERLFLQGGDSALTIALNQLKSQGAASLYLQKLLRNDTVTNAVLEAIIRFADKQPADIDKRKSLELVMNSTRLSSGQWPLIETSVDNMKSTPDKSALLLLVRQKQQ